MEKKAISMMTIPKRPRCMQLVFNEWECNSSIADIEELTVSADGLRVDVKAK